MIPTVQEGDSEGGKHTMEAQTQRALTAYLQGVWLWISYLATQSISWNNNTLHKVSLLVINEVTSINCEKGPTIENLCHISK